MKLTRLQLLWLKTRGDRDLNDVSLIDGRYYTTMFDGYEKINYLVELPSDEFCKKMGFYEDHNGHIQILNK